MTCWGLMVTYFPMNENGKGKHHDNAFLNSEINVKIFFCSHSYSTVIKIYLALSPLLKDGWTIKKLNHIWCKSWMEVNNDSLMFGISDVCLPMPIWDALNAFLNKMAYVLNSFLMQGLFFIFPNVINIHIIHRKRNTI